MASDIAPAAVPDPIGQPSSDTPNAAPGKGILGLLAPLEPARPTSASFNLDPAATTDTGEQALTSASSAAYQDDTPGKGDSGSKAGGKQQNGVMRSFALAAIERWKKGGDARNKRLDIQKAKAQAYQTKESRTVNRSEKFVGGSTNSGSASGKSTDSKSKNSGGGGSNGPSRNNSSKSGGGKNTTGPKNSRSGSGTGSGGLGGSKAGGRSNTGSGTGSGGSGGGRGGSGAAGHGAGGQSDSKTLKKDGRTDSSGSGKGGKTPAKHNSGTGAGARTETATCGDSSGISLTKDKKTKTPDNGATPKHSLKKTPPPAKTDTAAAPAGKDTPRKPDAKTTGATGGTTGDGQASTTSPKKDPAGTKHSLKKTPKDSTGPGKPGKDTDKTTPGKTSTDKPAPTKADGTPIRTQPSREAGYRDGARTALVTAHVKAYRDGFKDGQHDISTAADREKARLDQAHAQRQQERAREPKDQPVTASSTDYQPTGPQPIGVKEVTAQQVTLEGGQTLSHGEVRSLKQYERRIRAKATSMGKAAEGTRTLKAIAEQQAEQALKFVEMAKNVEGGERFIGVLNRLHEAATIQIREAEELHKRSLRGAESTNVVLTNVDIRYGGIYKAVIDSGLIAPANLHWYRK
ncbi:hypothetical protein AB0454_23030 [Streptomyces sp. NPDC093509]|uniref:hypothetical protein n=1 Tax=Streptomyces sp. NPDC093509 TaxID=3154982 RepID=UPI0034504790